MTPHDRLYAFTEEAIATGGPRVRKEGSGFLVQTAAGLVKVCDSSLANLEGIWLAWDKAEVARLFNQCREAYIASKLPQAATQEPDAAQEVESLPLPWWRLLWSRIRPWRALPRARLLKS